MAGSFSDFSGLGNSYLDSYMNAGPSLGRGFTYGYDTQTPSTPNNIATGGTGSWFQNIGGLSGIGSLLSGIGGLASNIMGAYTGLQGVKLAKQQLGLAREQFGYEKGLANRNLSNQAKTINNAYDSATAASVGLMGGIDARTGALIAPDQRAVDAIYASAKDRYVDGSPIA